MFMLVALIFEADSFTVAKAEGLVMLLSAAREDTSWLTRRCAFNIPSSTERLSALAVPPWRQCPRWRDAISLRQSA